MHTIHHDYILKTISLCQQSDFKTSPNPKVACLIVKNNNIIGQGIHQDAGCNHAEIEALNDAKQKGQITSDADLYINLEPCCHHGKTPPCTKALIQAGIKRVFIAMLDPNPLINGQGVAILRQHGIQVFVGFHEQLAYQLNRFFCYAIEHQKPYMIAKWAMGLNGELTTYDLNQKQISNQQSQQHYHQLRNQVDAIIIGANTANFDDPQLTTRFINSNIKHHPIRIILSREGKLKPNLNLLKLNSTTKTILVISNQISTQQLQHIPKHIDILPISCQNNQFNLNELLKKLFQKNIHSVIIEGGAKTLKPWLEHNLCQSYQVYIAPTINGKTIPTIHFSQTQCQSLGNNIVFSTFI